MKNSIVKFVLVIAVFAIRPTAFAANGIVIPIPPKAKEIQNLKPAGLWSQTNYLFEAKYPDTSVAAFYYDNVGKPWVRCFSGIPNWQSFGDSTDGNHRFVHQILMHWINRAEEKMLMVSVRYYSDGEAFRKEPDNDMQHVVVAEYPQQNIDQVIKFLNLKCEK